MRWSAIWLLHGGKLAQVSLLVMQVIKGKPRVDSDDVDVQEDEGRFPMSEVCVAQARAVHRFFGRRVVLASPAMVHDAHHDTPAVVRTAVPTFQRCVFSREGWRNDFPHPLIRFPP